MYLSCCRSSVASQVSTSYSVLARVQSSLILLNPCDAKTFESWGNLRPRYFVFTWSMVFPKGDVVIHQYSSISTMVSRSEIEFILPICLDPQDFWTCETLCMDLSGRWEHQPLWSLPFPYQTFAGVWATVSLSVHPDTTHDNDRASPASPTYLRYETHSLAAVPPVFNFWYICHSRDRTPWIGLAGMTGIDSIRKWYNHRVLKSRT